MKERPILFSGAMVRALLAGTKTQTRRVVKGIKHFPEWGRAAGIVGGAWRYGSPAGLGLSDRGDCWSAVLDEDHLRRMCTTEAYGWGAGAGCPYGQPGDRLWVREAWRTADTLDSMSPSAIADKCLDAGYRKPWAPLQWESDGSKNKDWSGFGPGNGVVVGPGKLRPGIHMPRWASRITLEVTGVRVERLQDISEADAQAEGADCLIWSGIKGTAADLIDWPLKEVGNPYRNGYAVLWESINGPESWTANPWVWVVEFKRLEAA